MSDKQTIELKSIGTIHTPWQEDGFCPDQPVEREEGESRIDLDQDYADALADLDSFSHIHVLFYLDRQTGHQDRVKPPWAKGQEVGLFASRSPRRPVPIGLSVVRLHRIEGTTLITGLLDAYDGTPVLDIKPYIPALDAPAPASSGWIEKMDNWRHLLDHVRGRPHDHGQQHGHEHGHEHEHDHEHGHEHGHEHEHEHDHEHDDGHEHSHTHVHEHEHEHTHEHSHEHSQEHDHGHSHDHRPEPDHSHEHTHKHSHEHEHEHSHKHSHQHDKDNEH